MAPRTQWNTKDYPQTREHETLLSKASSTHLWNAEHAQKTENIDHQEFHGTCMHDLCYRTALTSTHSLRRTSCTYFWFCSFVFGVLYNFNANNKLFNLWLKEHQILTLRCYNVTTNVYLKAHTI